MCAQLQDELHLRLPYNSNRYIALVINLFLEFNKYYDLKFTSDTLVCEANYKNDEMKLEEMLYV